MGGAESKPDTTSLHKDDPSAPTSEDTGAGGDGNHTPLTNRRLVKLRDPRSPTDDVSRTPIIVPKPGLSTDDSFEDPRSPTIKIARTPIPDTDPRSPTEGVTRTPCPFTYPDPRSPTINVARTPMLQQDNKSTGKFEMPPAVQPETIAETHEEEQNLSSNNSNSDDTARLIDQSQPKPDPLLSQEHSSEKGLVQIDTPEYEQQLSKMVEEQRLTEETVEDDSQKTSLIASSNGHSRKSKKTGLKLSLTAKIHGSQTAPPRSPLSTRNLEKDVHSVSLHSGQGLIIYDKTGSRRRQNSGTPTRLVGKYEPMLDKENF
ncbi:uncharacterized protein [Asterias amurensis]|uniref:uncharacterized protein n=1 Tax=Asterias amurensis TaxID=7602 RepID=UPI003AB80F0F